MGLLATGITLVALWAPPDPEAVRAALNRVLAEHRYQTELPGDRPSTDAASRSSGRTESGRGPRRRTGTTADHLDPSDGSVSPSGGGAWGGAAAALFWVIVCVLAVLLVVWLASEWRGRERTLEPPIARANAPPAPAMPAIPLDEIDALAAAGRHGEAIHLLLLRTIGALARTASSLSPALTSREILATVPFRPGARDALAGLVDAVEVSLFGGREVREADYLDCRARFDRFAALEAGATA